LDGNYDGVPCEKQWCGHWVQIIIQSLQQRSCWVKLKRNTTIRDCLNMPRFPARISTRYQKDTRRWREVLGVGHSNYSWLFLAIEKIESTLFQAGI
jgi:hypothetical protein